MLGGLLLVLITSSASAPAGQTEDAVKQWIRTHYEAVTLYRAGDTTKALALLDTIPMADRQRTVGAIWAQVERIAAGWPPRKEDVVQWTPRLLRALGALEMEAAARILAGQDRLRHGAAHGHIALANRLFELVALVVKEDEMLAARWLLAMGLNLMARAEFQSAWAVLIPACNEQDKYAPLLVACGSLMETYGSLPADRVLPLEFHDRGISMKRPPLSYELVLSPGARGISRARTTRNRYLDEARRYLGTAIKLDPKDNEAPLRLASVRLQRGDDREAAELLEGLLKRPTLDAREGYLARLFLSRVRDRQNRVDDAAAVLAAAPAAQSILVARSYNATRRGNAHEAATFAEDAARSRIDDPWWGYRFGQYWVPEGIFKALREEALK
jgi:tetratricopeptide (TPR) repeat protein